MYVSLQDTFDLICEEDTRIDITRDRPSLANKFTIKPYGILIQDTYNNPFFPIRPKPRIDTSKLDLAEVYRRHRELYTQAKGIYLPFHFCIEMVGDRFYIFNTRPLDMKFPLKNKEVKQRSVKKTWDETTNLFFKENIFDISEAIHVCLIGDSNIDVYTQRIYEVIGRSCVAPITRQYKLPGALYQRVFPLNLGKRFNFDLLSKFVRK